VIVIAIREPSLAEREAPRRRATGRNARSGNDAIGKDRPRSASRIIRAGH